MLHKVPLFFTEHLPPKLSVHTTVRYRLVSSARGRGELNKAKQQNVETFREMENRFSF